jgi:hypothetical protein
MNFLACFLAGMNVSRPECKPLLVLNFYDVPSIFNGHLIHFRPNLLGDSQNLGEGLRTVFAVLQENLTLLQAS